MKIEATQEELQALAGLLDAAVRQAGLRAAKDAALWVDKIETVMEAEGKENGDDHD